MGGDAAKIDIASGEIIAGMLPGRALRLVREWTELHGDESRRTGLESLATRGRLTIDPLP
jgi:Domain of unknown function (DUF4160)